MIDCDCPIATTLLLLVYRHRIRPPQQQISFDNNHRHHTWGDPHCASNPAHCKQTIQPEPSLRLCLDFLIAIRTSPCLTCHIMPAATNQTLVRLFFSFLFLVDVRLLGLLIWLVFLRARIPCVLGGGNVCGEGFAPISTIKSDKLCCWFIGGKRKKQQEHTYRKERSCARHGHPCLVWSRMCANFIHR